MKAELLEKLLDAGFSKDEIIRLARDEPEPQPMPEPQQTPEPNPEPTPEPQPDPEPSQDPQPTPETARAETDRRLDGIEKSISELIRAVQLQNLKTDSFTNNAESLEAQTDKIMGSIIRPEIERKD